MGGQVVIFDIHMYGIFPLCLNLHYHNCANSMHVVEILLCTY